MSHEIGSAQDVAGFVRYSGGPHISFPFGGEWVSLDLRFRGPLEAKSFARGLNSILPGPRKGSSTLNAHLMVVAAAVYQRSTRNRFEVMVFLARRGPWRPQTPAGLRLSGHRSGQTLGAIKRVLGRLRLLPQISLSGSLAIRNSDFSGFQNSELPMNR